MSTPHALAVLTSGGDAPGMNAAIRAVVRSCAHAGLPVFGVEDGYAGLLEGRLQPMQPEDVSQVIHRGGTMLRTARSEAFRQPEGRAKAIEQLHSRQIDGLVVIGGDGSYRGAMALSEEMPELQVIGLPGTIDNDLYGTDSTIGFDTALNTVIEAIDRIRDTAESTHRLFFVEVMGRSSGVIALQSAIAAGAEGVLVPELPTRLEELITQLQSGWRRNKRSSIIIVAEGDDAGGAVDIAAKVKQRLPAIETRVSVLGHIQRGGTPTARDRLLASAWGHAAVEALRAGRSGLALGNRGDRLVEIPLADAVDKPTFLNEAWLRLSDVLAS